MTKHEQVTHEDLLERCKKSVDVVLTIFSMNLDRQRLKFLVEVGVLKNPALVEEFEENYFRIRDELVPDIHPAHILWDEGHDKPPPEEIHVEIGDKVSWSDVDDRQHSGILIFVGRPFTRNVACPKPEDGWRTAKERAAFLKCVLTNRKKVKTPVHKLCTTGAIVRVKTRPKKGSKKPGYIYYCPLITELRKVEA